MALITASGGSNDAVASLSSISATVSINGDFGSGAHRYWRLLVHAVQGGANQNYAELFELHLFDKSNIATAITDAGLTDTYFESSTDSSSRSADNLFDHGYEGGGSPLWRSAFNQGIDSFVGVEFVEPRDLVAFTMVHGGTNLGTNVAPSDASLQFSDDGLIWVTRARVQTSWPTGVATNSDFLDYFKRFTVGSGGIGALTLPIPITQGSGEQAPLPSLYDGQSTFALLTSQGSVSNNVVAVPALSSTAQMLSGGVADTFFPIEFPEFDSVGTLAPSLFATLAGTLPRFSVRGVAHQAGDQTQAAYALPSLQTSGVARGGLVAQGVGYFASLTATAVAHNASPSAGARAQATFPSIGAIGYALGENLYAGASNLPALILAADGVGGRIGSITLDLPLFGAEGTGYAEGAASALAVTLPLLLLTARGSATQVTPEPPFGATVTDANAAEGETLSINVKNKSVTRFHNFGYNSFAAFHGITLAANERGVFALTGDTDDGALIDASLLLGKLDFDTERLKVVDYLYTGYHTDGEMQLSVRGDDGAQFSYPLHPRRSDDRHSARTRLGKGLKARYFQFGLRNVAGADFAIDSLEPEPREMARRIR